MNNGQGKAAIILYMALSTDWRRLGRIDLFHLADLAAKSVHLETVPQLRTRTVQGNTQQRRKRILQCLRKAVGCRVRTSSKDVRCVTLYTTRNPSPHLIHCERSAEYSIRTTENTPDSKSATHPNGRHALDKEALEHAPISTFLTSRVKYVEYTGDSVGHRLPLVGRLDRGIFRLLGKECERGGCGQQQRPLRPYENAKGGRGREFAYRSTRQSGWNTWIVKAAAKRERRCGCLYRGGDLCLISDEMLAPKSKKSSRWSFTRVGDRGEYQFFLRPHRRGQ